MYHVYGLDVVSLPFLHFGGKLVTLPAFEPKAFIDALEEYRVNGYNVLNWTRHFWRFWEPIKKEISRCPIFWGMEEGVGGGAHY